MNLTFVCQNCEDSFEVDLAHLSEDGKGVKCPSCGKKLTASETDDLATAVDEVLSQVAALRKRFVVSFDVDGEDLPPPYDADAKHAGRGREEDEDEDVEDEDTDHLEDDGDHDDEDL
jgi:predicted Zn finger-like uncharacterized protein